MLPRRIARLLTAALSTSLAVLTTFLLAAPAAAQKPLPPTYEELEASRPWTYWMAWALLLPAVGLIVLVVLGYLIKGREFRSNQRRGGTK